MRDDVHTPLSCAGCGCNVMPEPRQKSVVSHLPGLGIVRLCAMCAGKLLDEMALHLGQHELAYLREKFLPSMKGGK